MDADPEYGHLPSMGLIWALWGGWAQEPLAFSTESGLDYEAQGLQRVPVPMRIVRRDSTGMVLTSSSPANL